MTDSFASLSIFLEPSLDLSQNQQDLVSQSQFGNSTESYMPVDSLSELHSIIEPHGEQPLAYESQASSSLDYNPSIEVHQAQTDHLPRSENHLSDTSLLSDSNSSDDNSNNLNAVDLAIPTLQHHVHYHPPHEHFHIPHPWEKEHEIRQHALSPVESSLKTHHVLRSDVHHYHHVVSPAPPSYCEGSGGGPYESGSFDSDGSSDD
ncbi:MAG: hypothetical protein BWK78_03510 [Thiotrichaceae bacterium IS1]|nr:MAG: hypothetical protein BWK78_03510 [Thiotrichaceae bacterium IS1]